jgi:glycogen phosphorylase
LSRLEDPGSIRVAYFSMEIALADDIPTYSGGLGVLAGDMLRAGVDLEIPMVAVTLVHRKGYFRQRLDESGNQTEVDASWNPDERLEEVEARVFVQIEDRRVAVRAWRFLITGAVSHPIQVFLLDTALPENSDWDRSITDHLYGGDDHYRLCQEVVLGMGGVALLDRLGYSGISSYHMNEGHSAFLTLALLDRQTKGNLAAASAKDIEEVRSKCVFTTHTPVPAGHDQFSRDEVRRVLGPPFAQVLEITNCCPDGAVNMTFLALRLSHYINGVAMHHGEVSRDMFPRYPVRAITNGVHAATWTSEPFKGLFDRHIPEWRVDNQYLRYAIGIPLKEIHAAHVEAKMNLIRVLRERTGEILDPGIMTIGFARRATAYKRADLVFSRIDRLRAIAEHVGPLQIIFGGKAHSRDEEGKAMIRRIFDIGRTLPRVLKIIYVEDYDMQWARWLTSGVDLWLNTPHRPYEASGTSGMKAALNGVPSLSILDGWWIEGCVEGVTGWAVGLDDDIEDTAEDVASLYDKLQKTIVPMFYGQPTAYDQVMRMALSLNGSFFNTQRMLSQYMTNAYGLR